MKTDIEPKPKGPVPESLSGPVLVLTDNAKGGTPVSIPMVDENGDETSDPRKLDGFIFRTKRDSESVEEFTTTEQPESDVSTMMPDRVFNCTWTIKVHYYAQRPGLLSKIPA